MSLRQASSKIDLRWLYTAWNCCSRNFGTNRVKKSVTNSSTVQNIYTAWKKYFLDRNISEVEASVEYIIAHVLGKETLNGFNMEQPLSDSEIEKIKCLCEKRSTNMPIQYVLKEWGFGGLTLKMKPPVFIPRPETEGLVDFVIDEINLSTVTHFNLLEVGCGSGAISLALLHAHRKGKVKKKMDIVAVDKNLDAVHLTEHNAKLNNMQDLKMMHCDVTSLPLNFFVHGIVSNPPYIPTGEIAKLQPEIAQFESILALDGGEDGLDVIRDIVKVAETILPVHGWLCLEVDTSHPAILRNAFDNFQLAEVKKDYLDRNRFVKIVKLS